MIYRFTDKNLGFIDIVVCKYFQIELVYNLSFGKALILINPYSYFPLPFIWRQNLFLSELKAFADDKINVTEKLKFALGRVENIVVKGKMLVSIIFCFSHNVFNRLITQGR